MSLLLRHAVAMVDTGPLPSVPEGFELHIEAEDAELTVTVEAELLIATEEYEWVA